MDQEILDREFARGEESGQIKTRLGALETNFKETTKTLGEVGKLVTSLTTTVQLLDRDIKTRAENDRKNQELRDQNTKDIAKAVQDVVDTTALAATSARESLAQGLLNQNVVTNTKFVPRMFWIAFAGLGVTLLGSVIGILVTKAIGG